MKLSSLKAKDFCCFGEFDLSLKDMGLVLISGSNNDTQAAGNNGSGKSTILKAITWCLFGKTIDGERGDKVIRDGCSKTSVEATLEGGGESWTIIRERKKSSPGIKLVCPDGCDFKGDKNDIQRKIEQLLGLDFLTFKSSVMYGQNDSTRFIRPETSDADRKAVLHKILGTELLAECCSLARKGKRAKKEELDAIEVEVEKCEARLGDIDLEELSRLESEFDEEIESEAAAKLDQAREHGEKAKKAIKALKSLEKNSEVGRDIIEIRKEISSIRTTIKEKKDENRRRRQKANDELSKIQVEARKCDSKLTEFRMGVGHLEEQLEKLDGDKCSVCNSILSKGEAATYISALNDELNGKKSTLEKAKKRKAEINVRLESAKQACSVSLCNDAGLEEYEDGLEDLNRELREEQSRISRLESEKQMLRDRAKNHKETAARALRERETIQNKENNYTAMLVEAKKRKTKIKKELKKSERLRDEKLGELALLEFWSKGFSNQGLPSFLLDSVVPYITKRANHYLGILSDHDIKLNLSTQRELKSGEHRDKIDVTWEIEGAKDSYPPSGGQWKKMEIATDLALMDLVGNRSGGDLGFLALDEILDGLDAEGKSRVVDLLEHLKQQKETIFVITHDPDVSDVFEQTVVVEKTNGVSSLRVVN